MTTAPSSTPAKPPKSSDLGFVALLALTTIGILGTIHYVFYVVPDEVTMGFVQKIFYFHVPAAMSMYLGATICFFGSGWFLAKGSLRADAIARAGAEVTVVMGSMVMISGPLWGAKIWGHYWAWDAQLTTFLLSFLIYIAYVVLRTFTGGGEAERKFAAALGVLGAANLPIIHFAVTKWGGTHPEVTRGKGGGLNDPSMKIAFFVGIAVFFMLTALLVWARMRQHMASNRLDEVEQEALEAGIAED